MAQYRIGTATFTNGSATVTGTGTEWLSNVSEGDWIIRKGTASTSFPVYRVGGVVSDTELTLTAPYGGATATDVPYVVHIGFLPNGIGELENGDVESASIQNEANAQFPSNGLPAALNERVLSLNSIADLQGLTGVEDQQVHVAGYHPGSTVGGGIFKKVPAGDHDGGTFIDPNRAFPTPAQWAAGSSDPAVIAWFDAGGGTVDGWVRLDVEYLTPEMFGAVGDGVDDDAAIQGFFSFLDGSNINGKGTPGAEYAIATQNTIRESVFYDANGSVIVPNAVPALVVSPLATGVSTTLSADGQINQNKITVTDASSFSVGDLATLVSDKAWYLDPTPTENMKQGQLVVVLEKSGNVLTLRDQLRDNYDVSLETVTLTKLNKAKVEIQNFKVRYNAPFAGVGLEVRNSLDGEIIRPSVENAQFQGINMVNCYNTPIKTPNCIGANQNGLGYGIQLNECYQCHIIYGNFRKNRRGVDLSGTFPTRGCLIAYNDVDGAGLASGGGQLPDDSGSSGLGTHETSEGNIFWCNNIGNVKSGILLRGSLEGVLENTFYGDINNQLVIANRAVSYTIDNNKYYSNLSPGRDIDVAVADDDEQKTPWFIRIVDPAIQDSFIKIRNNSWDDLKNAFLNIQITSGAPFTTLKNIDCRGNSGKINGSTATTSTYFIVSGDQPFTIEDSYIIDNPVTQGAATLAVFGPGIILDYQNTVEVDNYPLPASVITSGSPNTTVNSHVLNLSVKNGEVRLVGYIDFSVSTSPSIVKLESLPNKTLVGGSYGPPISSLFIEGVSTGGVGSMGMVCSPIGASGSIPTSLWVSSDTTAYNSTWPVGGPYRVPIDVSYYTVRRLQ